MANQRRDLSSTTSLCPECLDRVPGTYETDGESVYLTRTCPDHGTASPKVWESLDHWEWAGRYQPDAPFDPGSDLTVDNNHACLAVVEVTTDCNLSCSYCFAGSGPGGDHLPFDEVVGLLEVVLESGGPRPVQFSGGEPTVREDLPELVARARAMDFDHVQVNTNGIALAERDGYAERLKEAGVTAIYLQFDGLRPDTYQAIRGVDLAEIKRRAVTACRRAGLSVVLVPTVVPDTNDDEMGDVVRYALDNLDVVESVNFQPVAHFGRYATDGGRFSLDEAARRLAEGFDELEPRDLMPIPCCSSYCQSVTALLGTESGPVPVTRYVDDATFERLSGFVDEADWMELLASTPAGADAACGASGCCGGTIPDDAAALFDRVLPISLTGFMDAAAADVARLDNCCVSVPTESGDLVPFCAYNMTTDAGRYALRNRHDWGGRPSVDEPLPTDD